MHRAWIGARKAATREEVNARMTSPRSRAWRLPSNSSIELSSMRERCEPLRWGRQGASWCWRPSRLSRSSASTASWEKAAGMP